MNVDGVGTEWQTIRHTHINIWLHHILTSPAVPHGHFAHPGLSNGGTGYCVLGWFLYNVPCPGLQTPLVATGFVSPGAGSPFAPLAHLAALCRDTNKRGCWAKPQQSAYVVATQRSSCNGALLGCCNLVVCGPHSSACFPKYADQRSRRFSFPWRERRIENWESEFHFQKTVFFRCWNKLIIDILGLFFYFHRCLKKWIIEKMNISQLVLPSVPWVVWMWAGSELLHQFRVHWLVNGDFTLERGWILQDFIVIYATAASASVWEVSCIIAMPHQAA